MPLNHELKAGRRTGGADRHRQKDYGSLRSPRAAVETGLLRVAPAKACRHRSGGLGAADREFRSFVAAVPAPLSIGTLKLGDGRNVKFLVEPPRLRGARDISSYGGWRAYMAQIKIA